MSTVTAVTSGIDATRVMIDSRPQRPTDSMKQPNQIIVSRDQATADAATSLPFVDSAA